MCVCGGGGGGKYNTFILGQIDAVNRLVNVFVDYYFVVDMVVDCN